MKLDNARVYRFRKYIFSWWRTHRRDLPWRHTNDPYKIFVSEVMLQQTQVSRVVPKYREFLNRFPSLAALAQATPAQVLRAWKGMGYNRRALYLQKAAKVIVEEHQGNFPISEQELIVLPGLGKYTARAILVFAYHQEVQLVDTNTRQIITHFFFKDQPQKESAVEEVARQLVPPGKSWEWHQALMDYNAIAMSKFKTQMLKVKKKTIPFRESNRFFRGRIIDRLREGDILESKLIRELEKKYAKPAVFLRSIVESLIRDGLIQRAPRGVLRLPGV